MSCEGCPSQGSCNKDAASCQTKPNSNNHIRHIAAIMSGKGGVGKSTCAVMLARAMAAQGKKVGIMDADITGPSIPRLMGLENEKAYATPDNQIIPIESPEGIKMISLNYMLPDENEPVIWRGPIVANVVKQFYTDVLWGDLDVLLIDMPPGTGDVALTILQEFPVNGVVMISTPQPMVSMIVTKAIRMCEKMGIAVLGVIENMAYLNCPHCDEKILFYNEDELNEFITGSSSRLYGTIPQIDLVRDINRYDTYTLREQEKVNSLFASIAEDVLEDLDHPAKKQEA